MFEQDTINHHIQRRILSVLCYRKMARFRDLRPPRVDTNLFSYHLKVLISHQLVQKVPGGYSLAPRGLAYVDRVSTDNMLVRTQPKIVTMLVVQNSNGDVLLQQRTKQPYIDTWTLPYGKLHIDDRSIQAAAQREAAEKLDTVDIALQHAGECYIRVWVDKAILSTTLAHVFYGATDDITPHERLIWARPHRLAQYTLAPAVEQIVARAFFHDPYFFEEFDDVLDQ